jgi:hypothetical protein
MEEEGFEFELEHLLMAGSYLLWLFALWFGWKKSNKVERRLRRFLFLALLCLPLYVHLEPILAAGELLTPYGLFDIWIRHAAFYLGQLFFFLFIFHFVSLTVHRPGAKRAAKVMSALSIVFFLSLIALTPATHAAHTVDIFEIEQTPYNVLLFITDQGVQHILAILFFFLTIAAIRTQSLYVGRESMKQLLYGFFLANSFFIAIHVWEYMAESQHLFPSLEHEVVELIEFGLQYVALALMFIPIRRVNATR